MQNLTWIGNPEGLEPAETVFKAVESMNAEERKIIYKVNKILSSGLPNRFTIQEAAFYLANQHRVVENLFAPQKGDHDYYLAQNYALKNALLCVLFAIHESHEILTFLKRKKNLHTIKEVFYKEIEKKMSRWTNAYIGIRNKNYPIYTTYLAILHKIFVLKLNRLLIQNRNYWNKLLESVQNTFIQQNQEMDASKYIVSETDQTALRVSDASTFLIDLRKRCLDIVQKKPGAEFTFYEARTATQLKWIVMRWNSAILMNDIVWAYQDLFDERLWQTFKKTRLTNFENLRSSIEQYKKYILSKNSLMFRGKRGKYYTILKGQFLEAFKEKEEDDPLFMEYLDILAAFVKEDKDAPSPFSRVTKILKGIKGLILFSIYEKPEVEEKPPISTILNGGECVCPNLYPLLISAVLSKKVCQSMYGKAVETQKLLVYGAFTVTAKQILVIEALLPSLFFLAVTLFVMILVNPYVHELHCIPILKYEEENLEESSEEERMYR